MNEMSFQFCIWPWANLLLEDVGSDWIICGDHLYDYVLGPLEYQLDYGMILIFF